MDKENGDDYIRRTASYIRRYEQRLADAAIVSRRRPQKPPAGSQSVLGWIGLGSTEQSRKPLIFTDDPHHLFYLLMRFESLGISVGSLDVRVQNPSRPISMSYLAMLALKDRSDALSVSSFRSTMSSVSMFSLGGGWFGRTQPASLDAELKYLYSAFTKLPALRVCASGLKVISELAEDPPIDSAIPMDAFKNLQTLECQDIDPRTLMGWDQLSEGLRSLTVKRSGLEDVSDLFVDSVIDDKLRREGSPVRVARPRLVHRPPSFRLRQPSFHTTQLPSSVPEASEQTDDQASQDSQPERQLPSYAWSLLTHLSLSDNNLTFLPSFPPLPMLNSLDLSSNLLISVPPSLVALPALKSLNLAHNMVDSVLGIYSQIPLIVTLNISANRLESLCGLERLEHLSRVDLRDNRVEDTDEIGRLAVLGGMKEVWVSGNPCTRRDQEWRVRCFDLFGKEGREILLDGSPPGLMERRVMLYHAQANSHGHPHGDNGRPLSQSHPSPALNGSSRALSPSPLKPAALQQTPPLEAARASPAPSVAQSFTSVTGPGLQPKARRRNKRFVDLNGNESADEPIAEVRGPHRTHGRHSSDVGVFRHGVQPGGSTFEYSAASNTANPTEESSRRSLPRAEENQGTVVSPPSAAAEGPPSLKRSSTLESPATISHIQQAAGTSRTLLSGKTSKRRARLSPSVYEPASVNLGFPEQEPQQQPKFGSPSGQPAVSEAELFRRRIEALRNEVGDGWLKVLSQTQLSTPPEVRTRRKS